MQGKLSFLRDYPSMLRSGPGVATLSLITVLILFSRRPDAFTNPQFWAEDGAVWYANAYNFGWWKVLLVPSAGYIQILPRLCAAAALAFPLAYAPALCNAAAIVLEGLPAIFLLTRRFDFVAALPTRAYLAFLYLVLPNSSELHANITCAQWHLAVLLFLILIAEVPQNGIWRCFDMSAAALCTLSGPFAIFLAPLALALWWKTRHAWRALLAVVLTLGAVIQGLVITEFANGGRSHKVLGATAGRLLKILASKIFLAAIIGGHDQGSMQPGWNRYLVVATMAVAFAASLFWYALVKGPLELKLFIALGMMLLVAALVWPMASMDTPQWYVLQASRSGLRYWFVPMLVFVTTLVWASGRKRPPALRRTAITLLLFMMIGIVRDWRYTALADLHFEQYAAAFQQAASGSRFRIPINPPGWSIELLRHAP